MQKIQELVKEGNLAKSLMADKEFVDGAKEILKSEKIEMDDAKLKQLLDEIESKLKTSEIMSPEELENVSGGVDWKSVGKSAARKTIKTVSTVTGLAVGTAMGTGFGYGFGYGMGTGVGAKAYAEKIAGTSAESPPPPPEEAIAYENVGSKAGAAVGGVSGLVTGAPIGGYVGYKLGNWICKATGLEE